MRYGTVFHVGGHGDDNSMKIRRFSVALKAPTQAFLMGQWNQGFLKMHCASIFWLCHP
jgi:hypothetical protein